MHLYALTLQRATAITSAAFGNFSGPQQQEIIVARGKILEVLRPDVAGRLHSVHATEVFGLIRSLQPFRLTGAAAMRCRRGSSAPAHGGANVRAVVAGASCAPRRSLL